jgi:hypothetical protein
VIRGKEIWAMSWSFAFSALVALLLYLALQRRIDSAVEQLKHDIAAGIEGLQQGRGVTTTQREQPKDKHDELICERVKHDELIREGVERNFSACTGRYTVQDAYTISELTRSYDRKDSRGRIQLLRRVYRQTPCLPYELALRAVTDSDPEVREWMARKAQNLNYRETRHESADALLDIAHPDRDLTLRLRQDADPFVRAALLENPELFNPSFWRSDEWIEEFKGCSLLERLAMMRNEALHLDLVELILDPDDTKLEIDKSERYQLAKACLVNRRVVDNGRRSRTNDFADGYAWHLAGKRAAAVWELAAKWPDPAGVPFLAFHTVQTDDRVKAKIYLSCQAAPLRAAIIESCLPEDEQTLRLGRADTDRGLRSMAYSRSRRMDRQEIEDALRREKGEKDNGMDGLFTNPWLEPIAREILDSMAERDDTVLGK